MRSLEAEAEKSVLLDRKRERWKESDRERKMEGLTAAWKESVLLLQERVTREESEEEMGDLTAAWKELELLFQEWVT